MIVTVVVVVVVVVVRVLGVVEFSRRSEEIQNLHNSYRTGFRFLLIFSILIFKSHSSWKNECNYM